MKKYSKIIRHGKSSTHLTIEGNPEIIVMEKLDGANASFKVEDGIVKCFSRNKELDEDDNLRGFREWVRDNINHMMKTQRDILNMTLFKKKQTD